MTAAQSGATGDKGRVLSGKVVVVGAGITGLSAAWELAKAGCTAITVVETSDATGGKVATGTLGGAWFNEGPDAFVARGGVVRSLCSELGLDEKLISPGTSQAWCFTRGKLRPYPANTLLGVPTRVGKLMAADLLSPLGRLRALADLVLPGSPLDNDEALASLLRRRLGREASEAMVEPLVAGINAARATHASVQATAAPIAAAARRSRSLILGAKAVVKQTRASNGPVFLGLDGGMATLTTTLETALEEAGVCILRSWEAIGIDRSKQGWRLVGKDRDIDADAVLLACPAKAAARILSTLAPAMSELLATIDYASVASIGLSYPASAVPSLPPGSGFLVPATEGTTISACTFVGQKWPQLGRKDRVLLRAFVGRAGESRALDSTDAELIEKVHADLARILGLQGPPDDAVVTRWPVGLPQYQVGHLSLAGTVHKELRSLGALDMAGAALDGVGIAACIESARRCSEHVAARLAAMAQSG